MALARFEGTATNESGDVVPLAYIEVRREQPGRPVVPLWADREGTVPLGNPIQANEKGQFGFHCVGGSYYIRFYLGSPSAPTLEYIRRYQAIGTSAERDVETLASMLEAGTATFATLAELDAFTPAASNVGGKVTTGAGAGFYHWDGDEWVFDRGLHDTLARFTVTGGTANAVTATLEDGVTGDAVTAYVIKPTLTNTSAVTINGKALLNINGDALSNGEFPADRLIMFTDEGASYQMLSDPAVDALLAQAITVAGETEGFRDEAEAFKDAAELAAGGASGLHNKMPEIAKTANYTLTTGDAGKMVTFQSPTAVTATLPSVASAVDRNHFVMNIGDGLLSVVPNGADSFEGLASLDLPKDHMAQLWVSAVGGKWRALVFAPSRGDEWVHFPREVMAGAASWWKGDLAGYRDVEIEGYLRSSAEPSVLDLNFSRDNGASWDTGNNYTWHRVYGVDTVANAASDGDTSDPRINVGMTGSIGSGGGEGVHFTLRIFNFNQPLARVKMEVVTFTTAGLYVVGFGGGVHGGAGATRSGVRLKFTSGNMAEGYVLVKARA